MQVLPVPLCADQEKQFRRPIVRSPEVNRTHRTGQQDETVRNQIRVVIRRMQKRNPPRQRRRSRILPLRELPEKIALIVEQTCRARKRRHVPQRPPRSLRGELEGAMFRRAETIQNPIISAPLEQLPRDRPVSRRKRSVPERQNTPRGPSLKFQIDENRHIPPLVVRNLIALGKPENRLLRNVEKLRRLP